MDWSTSRVMQQEYVREIKVVLVDVGLMEWNDDRLFLSHSMTSSIHSWNRQSALYKYLTEILPDSQANPDSRESGIYVCSLLTIVSVLGLSTGMAFRTCQQGLKIATVSSGGAGAAYRAGIKS